MRVLFLGDIVGRAARDAAIEQIPRLRQRHRLDLVVINAENAAGGFGVTDKIAQSLYEAGVDVITLGNHAFDQRDIMVTIGSDSRMVRPCNFPEGTPGRGFTIVEAGRGRKALVINAMGRVFMNPLDDPFASVDRILKRHPLGASVKFVLVDFHGEATSEKMAMGHFCDGRASLVVGTHSHVPTADSQILPAGTAYQTDAGMCGDYDSVIGMDKTEPLQRFTRGLPSGRFEPALGEATLCGVIVESDDKTGLARRIDPVRLGGRLSPIEPAATVTESVS